jgi:CheY-like chemotaxis protein
VVPMNIEMPIMDGKTCTRKIRELQQEGALYHRIPVIAVTGNARAQQIEDAMGCGFDDVVSKPYRVAELIPRIDKFAE